MTVKRIIHAHNCAICGQKIYWCADVSLVNGEPVFKHTSCATVESLANEADEDATRAEKQQADEGR